MDICIIDTIPRFKLSKMYKAVHTLVFDVIQPTLDRLCFFFIFFDRCQRGQGTADVRVSGLDRASIYQQEHPSTKIENLAGLVFRHISTIYWPESLQPAMFARISIKSMESLQPAMFAAFWPYMAMESLESTMFGQLTPDWTTYYKAPNHYCHRCLDNLLHFGQLRTSPSTRPCHASALSRSIVFCFLKMRVPKKSLALCWSRLM